MGGPLDGGRDFGGWAAAVEGAEKRKNSRVLRDVQVSLPAELDTRQQEALLRRIALDLAEKYDTTCTWHHHRADRRGDQRNQHGHVLMATRQIGENGTFGKKLRQLDDTRTGPEEITAIREIFERRTNEALKAAGRPERITALRDPDVEPEFPPQPTLGAVGTGIERRAAAERRGAPVVGEAIAETVADGAVTAPGHRLARHTAAVAEDRDITDIERCGRILDAMPEAARAEALRHAAAAPRVPPPAPSHALADLQAEDVDRRRVAALPAEGRAAAAAPPRVSPPAPSHAPAHLRAEKRHRRAAAAAGQEIGNAHQGVDWSAAAGELRRRQALQATDDARAAVENRILDAARRSARPIRRPTRLGHAIRAVVAAIQDAASQLLDGVLGRIRPAVAPARSSPPVPPPAKPAAPGGALARLAAIGRRATEDLARLDKAETDRRRKERDAAEAQAAAAVERAQATLAGLGEPREEERPAAPAREAPEAAPPATPPPTAPDAPARSSPPGPPASPAAPAKGAGPASQRPSDRRTRTAQRGTSTRRQPQSTPPRRK